MAAVLVTTGPVDLAKETNYKKRFSISSIAKLMDPTVLKASFCVTQSPAEPAPEWARTSWSDCQITSLRSLCRLTVCSQIKMKSATLLCNLTIHF